MSRDRADQTPSSPGPDTTPRRRAFHGRRRGRKLRKGLQALVSALLPRIGLGPLPGPGMFDPATLFAAASLEAVWLEIGFGGGEHLAWQARGHPGVGLIGAEYFIDGIAKLLRRVDHEGLANVRVYQGDARDLLDALADESIARVFILFPDPWPKTRHHKRRLVAPETLASLARVMKDGVELRLASDDMEYVRWMLERLCQHPDFAWCARRPGDWRARPDDWPETRYEAKAKKEGRACVYLRFRRRPRGARIPGAGPGEKP